jgi:L-lactate dehydrogenase (cytochrome)/(S)-mandelate dehydrogenase
MNLDQALSIGDLRLLAKRRLPKILFELIESGVEDEHGLERNEAAFRDYRMLPRYLGDIHVRDIGTTLFGVAHAAPFGIAPTGFASLLRPGAEFQLAEAARKAGIPFIVSGAGAARIEDLVKANPDLWYHLYPAKQQSITDDIVSRVADAGVSTLVLTVDNPVYPKRERDTRNGFSLPLRMRPSLVLDGLLHPAWVLDYLRTGGIPVMDTWARYAPQGSNGAEVAAFFRSQSPSIQTWKDLDALRRRWTGRFVLKGLQHPDDARRAVDAGIDAIIVSNHGGKSFDKLPSPLETLPFVKEAVGGRVPVMLDSGIRRGADIAIALCLGADFVFVGRATLYGAVAGGQAGAERAIAILKHEIDLTLAMIGCPAIRDLGQHFLLGPGPSRASLSTPAAPNRGADPTVISVKRNIA